MSHSDNVIMTEKQGFYNMAKKRVRYQKQFKFWLNALSKVDQEIMEDIAILKIDRKFTDAIRDGLRLIPSLMRGETKVLFEMFPAIRDVLYAQMEADVLERLGVEKDKEVIQHIIRLEGIVAGLSSSQQMLSAPMTGKVTMRDVTIEEDIELEVNAYNDGNSSQNFINSMAGLMKATGTNKIEAPKIKELSVPSFSAPIFDDD